MRKLYMVLGILVVLIGFSIFFLYLYSIISSTLLTAFSLSITILGYTSIGLAYARPNISPDTKGIVLRTNNTLLIILAAEFVIINGLLAFFKQYDLSIYIVISTIVYFITLWFYIALNPELRNALTAVAVAVFFECLIVITFRITEII
jgi:hypothetical protein